MELRNPIIRVGPMPGPGGTTVLGISAAAIDPEVHDLLGNPVGALVDVLDSARARPPTTHYTG